MAAGRPSSELAGPSAGGGDGWNCDGRAGLRWAVPAGAVVAVAALIAGTEAATAQPSPSLPSRTAAQLVAGVAAAARPVPLTGTYTETAESGPAQPAGRQRRPVRAGPAVRDAHVHDLGRRRPGTADRRARPAGRGRRAPVREPDLAVGQPHPAGHEHHPARHHHPGRAQPGSASSSPVSPSSAAFTPVPSDSLPSVPLTPQQLGRRILAAIGPTTVVSVRGNVTVAGQPAYQLVLAPKDSRSLIGQVTIAIDARHSLPLRRPGLRPRHV